MIKKYIKKYIKIRLLYLIGIIKTIYKPIELELEKNKRHVFVMLAADYDNLGDIAITKAQIEFLRRYLPNEYQIIEVNYNNTYKVYKCMKRNMTDSSIITLIGGGNSGTLYEFIEAPRRFVLKKFRKYNIISFPQTVIYENEYSSIPIKREFIKLCKKCLNLTLIARERRSFEEYENLVGAYAKVLITPDIVFSLRIENDIKIRDNKVSFILRDDKEKSISIKKQNELIDIVKELFESYSFNDTCDVSVKKDRFEVLNNYIKHLMKSKLVITDRLHGMIFCYITNTPCIVLKNNNWKIDSTYNTWLKKQNFIILCHNEMTNLEIKEIINNLINVDKITKEDISMHFKDLLNRLQFYTK